MSKIFLLMFFIISLFFNKTKNSYISNPLDLEDNKLLFYINETEICLQENLYEILKILIEAVKSEPDNLYILKDNKSDNLIRNFLKKYINNEEYLDLIINMKKNISKYPDEIDNLIQIIKKNNTVLDYILLFSNNTNGLNGTMNILNDLVVNQKQILKIFYNLIKNNKDFLDIIKFF